MRVPVGCLALALAICGGVTAASASVVSEGVPPYWFDAQFMGPPGADGTLRLGLNVGGLYDKSTVGEARLLIPRELELVSGDTLIRCQLAEDNRVRTLILRARQPGTHTIRGYLTVSDPGLGRDEAELEVAVTVSADSIIPHFGRVVREERVRGGQRFRFGGSFMIPIDESERVTQNELTTSGKHPTVVHRQSAACVACPESRSVWWVVFLNPHGKMRDARPLAVTAKDSVAVAATRQALRSWTFLPASHAGRNVSDYVVVQVPITSQP